METTGGDGESYLYQKTVQLNHTVTEVTIFRGVTQTPGQS
jgi:hypothetical protein